MTCRSCIVALFVVCGLSSTSFGEDRPVSSVSLPDGLKPFLQMLSGKQSEFDLHGDLKIKIDGKPQPVKLRLVRFDDEAFDLELSHPEYAVQIRRRADSTALILPLHKVAYVGRGNVAESVRLSPKNISDRLISAASEVKPVVTMLSVIQPEFIDPLMELVKKPLKAERDPATQQWMLPAASPVHLPSRGR